MDTPEVFYWLIIVVLQAAYLIRLVFAFWHRRVGETSGSLLWQRLKKSWHAVLGPSVDPRMARELDLMRCRLTLRFWTVGMAVALIRSLFQQFRLLFGLGRTNPELDGINLIFLLFGLLLQYQPNLVNPQTLDTWIALTSLLRNASSLPAAGLDAKDILIASFGLLFFSCLTRRTWLFVALTLASCAQVQWMVNTQETVFFATGEPTPQNTVVVVFGLPMLLCAMFRRLFHEQAILRMDLQKSTVELGAVSSLLLVCYDAVIEVKDDLTLTTDSPQLSGVLLRTSSLAGKSLLELCSNEDKDRVSQNFASSVAQETPVMALHVDMLDGYQNHIKVELLHAQFRNFSNERCFLIGVRELQYAEAGPAPLQRDSFPMCLPLDPISFPSGMDPDNLRVMFDVPSFEVLLLSPDFEQLCQYAGLPKVKRIVDLSSPDSRDSFNRDLQDLINALTLMPREREVVRNDHISFGLLGLGTVNSSITLQKDDFLETVVATMHIHGSPSETSWRGDAWEPSLTQANVHDLESVASMVARDARIPVGAATAALTAATVASTTPVSNGSQRFRARARRARRQPIPL